MEVTQPAGGSVIQVCVESLPWAEEEKALVAGSLLAPPPAAHPHFWEDPKSYTLRQTQRSPEGPRHLHRIPRLSEAPWEAP